MSQRDSGYERKERDCYETPEWVTEALIPHLPFNPTMTVWEPAAGSGKIVRVLKTAGYEVRATDINDPVPKDFFEAEVYSVCHAIITNPPYDVAPQFIARALGMMSGREGAVAMLLRTDFDHAKSRAPLFNHSAFAKKVVLTRRIRWFEDSKGSPSFNHAWFIWDWKHSGPPNLAYVH